MKDTNGTYKELRDKSDEELNKIFIEEVLNFETEPANNGEGYFIFLNKIDSQPEEGLGHIRGDKRRYIASTYFRPTNDFNIIQVGIDKLTESDFIFTVANHIGGSKKIDVFYCKDGNFSGMNMVFDEWSKDFKSPKHSLVIACIVAVRSQS